MRFGVRLVRIRAKEKAANFFPKGSPAFQGGQRVSEGLSPSRWSWRGGG